MNQTTSIKPSGRPKGGYQLADGTRVPGVTTIIGRFKDSGALMQWAFMQGRAGKERLYEETERAADIGTYAHELVQAWLRKEGAPLSPLDEAGTVQAQTAFGAFLKWAEQTRLRIQQTEIPLVSEQYRFGGALDAVGYVGDDLCLLDWKTSNGVYTDYLIQLAAYRYLWELNNPAEPLVGFHLLRFAKEHGDFAHHYFPNLDDGWRMFVLLREAYDLDKQLKKRV